MKKNYFFAKAFAIAAIVGLANTASAQVFFTEDFEGVMDAGTDIPTGWSEAGSNLDGLNVNIWSTDDVGTASSAYLTWPALTSGTIFAYTNDDDCNCDKSADSLILPTMDFMTETGGLGTVNLMFESYMGGGYGETANVLVSIDGGANWTTLAPIPTGGAWIPNTFSLGAYVAESSVTVAIVYNDASTWAYGLGINNVSMEKINCSIDGSLSVTGAEYASYPLSQIVDIVTPTANVDNINSTDLTNVVVELEVFDITGAPAVVYSETAGSIASITAGNNADATFTGGYTPSSSGLYAVQYYFTSTEVDCITNNDTVVYFVEVNDSVYARDNANLGGTISLAGLGTGSGGIMGQSYQIINDDTLTAVNVFISNQDGALQGQQLTINVYDIVGGQPTNVLATTMTPVLDSAINKNSILECILPQSLPLGPGNYFVGIEEGAVNIGVGTTLNNYVNGPIMVNAYTLTTGFVEQSTVYTGPFVWVIRPVFGTVTSSLVGINENDIAQFDIMPNPAVDNLMVRNIEAGNTVEVYNNLGQVVFRTKATSTNVNVDVANYDNGFYTVKVIGETVSTKTFVKQ